MGTADAKKKTVTPWRTVWRGCRHSFRWLRILILAAILLGLIALTWLRLVGLPDFLRHRIVDELAQRGIIANFRSLHFHWFRGFVADDLRVAWGGTNGTRIQIAEADLDISPPTWRTNATLVRGVSVRRGTLLLPLHLTNEPPLSLRLEDITGQVRFLEGDHWEVPWLSARVASTRLELRATLTNTAALRRRGPTPDLAARQERVRLLRAVVNELNSWTATSSARVEIHLNVDGADLAATHGDLYVDVPAAKTTRGAFERLRLSLRVQPSAGPGEPSRSSAVLEVGEVHTSRGGLTDLSLRAYGTGPPGSAVPTNAVWQANLGHLFVRGCRARGVSLEGDTRASVQNPSPGEPSRRAWPFPSVETDLRGNLAGIQLGATDKEPIRMQESLLDLHLVNHPDRPLPARAWGSLTARTVSGSPGDMGHASLRFNLTARTNLSEEPSGLGWWAPVWPIDGDVEIDLENLKTPHLEASKVRAVLDWRPPRFALRQLDASLGGGRLQARGGLDLLTREAVITAETSLDLHVIDALLGPSSRENFSRYQWTTPPWFEGQVRFVLPAWTNRHPDWEGEFKPTLRLDSRFKTGPGSFKGIPFDRAESTLSFDGEMWRLPDLRTQRPEGGQEIAVEYNEDTQVYRVDARGRIEPPVLKPVLGTQSADILDLFEFHNGVDADVTVWGPWTDGTSQAIRGSLTATNFIFRGERFDRLESSLDYTNRFLRATPIRLQRDGGEVTAESVGYDFAEDRLWLTNAVCTMDPKVAAQVIQPGFPEKIAPYRFASPPRIQAQGTVQPRQTSTAAMTFKIEGGPFEFWRLRAESIETELHWQGTTLGLSNLHAAFFGGSLTGGAFFDLKDPAEGRYQFDARLREADLGDLLHGMLDGRTNVSDGTFDLDLTVTSALTSDIHSWNGFGRAELRDGLLWDSPIFGFLSPVLNTIVPGLGNNRARAAEATFTLTNGVVHTRDLVIACPPAKLLYRGTLDFDQHVNAKVEALVLGDFMGVGPLFGLILRPLTKLFEFRVTGTLAKVDAEPLYVPKFLLLPLQPLKILRGLFGGGDGRAPPDTNGPPASVDRRH